MDGVFQHHLTTDPLAVRVLETPEEFLLCCGVASTLMLCGTWNPLRQSMELKGLQLTGYSTRSAGALRKALSEAAGMDTEQCYI